MASVLSDEEKKAKRKARKKVVEASLKAFSKSSGDKSTAVARHVAKMESNLGKARGVESIGNTKGIYHITQQNAISHSKGDLKKKLRKMSKKEYTEYTNKNPEVEARLAGTHVKKIYKSLGKKGVVLDNLTENEKASVVGNLYNYPKQKKLTGALKELSEKRFVANPEYTNELKENVTKNMDVTTAAGVELRGLKKRRNIEKKLFKKEDAPIKKIESTPKISRGPAGVKMKKLTPGEELFEKSKEIARQAAKQKQAVIEEAQQEEQQKQKDSVVDASMATDALDKAAAKLSLEKSIAPSNKEDMVIKSSSPKKLYENAKDLNSTSDSKENKPSKPSDNFRDALTFFAPQLLAGVIGQAMGGDVGMVAGIERGGKLRDSYINYKSGQSELQMKKDALENKKIEDAKGDTRTFQQSSQWMTKEGKPVVFDSTTGVYTDPVSKAVIPRENIINQVQGRHAESLDIKKQNLAFSMNKFGFSKEKAAQLSDAQTKSLHEMTTVEKSIDRIGELRKQVNSTGPLAGRVQSFGQWFDAAPKEFNQMKVQTASTLSNYVKSISGAQVTEQEATRLEAIIPSVNDAPGVFKDKLDEFKRIVSMNKQAFAEAISSGQPLKAGTVKGLMEAEKKLSKQAPKSAVKTRSAYEQAISNAKSVEEIEQLKKQYGAR